MTGEGGSEELTPENDQILAPPPTNVDQILLPRLNHQLDFDTPPPKSRTESKYPPRSTL